MSHPAASHEDPPAESPGSMSRAALLSIRTGAACLLAFSLTACVHPEVTRRKWDTRDIRELQEMSLAGVPEKPIAGQGIREFFSGKVALIRDHNGVLPIGRAVPLTRDGYMLTAWHVVDDGDFLLSDTVRPIGSTPLWSRI
ncbi:MAG: hypothetical protein EOP85_19095, partial [Verrucomicrobiaceae bacterium]